MTTGTGDQRTRIKLPHDGWVFVGDGRKALFLRNEGDDVYPTLRVERLLTREDAPNREILSDRPGRVFQSADSRRSAAEQTDWHELEEQHFARDVAAAFEDLVAERGVKAIVVVAPPRTLAVLRGAFSDAVRGRILAEINKDLTRHPLTEIEAGLFA